MNISKFFHRLLNPHCEQCQDERESASICKSCETLKVQLEVANHEKAQLLSALLPREKLDPVSQETPEPVKGRHIPFNVKRQMLEAESRHQAMLLKQKQVEIEFNKIQKAIEVPRDSNVNTTLQSQSIEELEKELGVENG